MYLALLMFAGVAWGSTMVLAKLSVADGHAAMGVAWWQAMIGAVLLGALTHVRGKRLPVSRRHLIFYLALGALGTAIPHSVSFTVASHLPASLLSVIISTVPLLTYAIAVPIGAERLSAQRVLGTGLGIAGILILLSPTADLGMASAIWIAIALISPLCYAVENLTLDKATPHGLDPISTLCGMSLGALILLTPIVLLRGDFVSPVPPWGTDDLAVGAMALIHIAAYTTLIYLIEKAGPVFASQLAYVVTLSGVAWGMAVLAERPGGGFWIALGLLIAGLALVNPRRSVSTKDA
ncbi:MAG: DMT family transporter [Alphaproteobacteria bacterium]|nr:DMT family transporter [Alphaproteobacteria bacterium]